MILREREAMILCRAGTFFLNLLINLYKKEVISEGGDIFLLTSPPPPPPENEMIRP